MPTQMKTKDSLKRKRGRRKKEKRWRRKREVDNSHRGGKERSSGSANVRVCVAFSSRTPRRHLASSYTKAGRAPRFPVTCLSRSSFGHVEAFTSLSRANCVCVPVSVKGQIHRFPVDTNKVLNNLLT